HNGLPVDLPVPTAPQRPNLSIERLCAPAGTASGLDGMRAGDRPSRPSSVEEAASAVQRALLTCIGPGAAEQIALAQARLAWQEVTDEAGLSRGQMHSRLTRVTNGAARI